MDLKTSLEKFKDEAERIISEKKVKEIVFFSNIYEIQILDKNEYFPILKLDDDGNILDAFCSCDMQEEEKFCFHILAAYLSCVKDNIPLHVRYRNSFFYIFFKNICRNIGTEFKNLKNQDNFYFFEDIFSLQAVDEKKKKINDFSKGSFNEINESNIKFSAFSKEDLVLLKEKKAPFDKEFEVSIFSDIAKWLFIISEKEKYKIIFKNTKIFPDFLEIHFEDLLVSASINESFLLDLIPALKSVNSNLTYFPYKNFEIDNIFYDKIKSTFFMSTKEIFKISKDLEHKIDRYIYLENVGFYPIQEENFFLKKEIKQNEIYDFLRNYKDIVINKIKGDFFYKESKNAHYDLYFDQNQNLIIDLYIFEKNDFSKPFSKLFKNFAYIQDKGFWEIKDLYFADIKTIIKKEEVSSFITNNKEFLQKIKNYQIHFGAIKSTLSYFLNKNIELEFDSKINLPITNAEIIDFDDWVYVKNIGFYSKKEKKASFVINPNIKVKKDEIGSFIDSNKEKLEQIEGFFSEENPIDKVGLSLKVTSQNEILIKPKIFIKDGYDLENIIFIYDYGYLKDKGFFKISKNILPKKYINEKILKEDEINFFITYEIESVKPFIVFLDKKLSFPKYFDLYLEKIEKKKKRNKTVFIAEMYYKSNFGKINLYEILKAFNENRKYLLSNAGCISLKDKRFNYLKNLKGRSNRIELTTLDLMRLLLFENVQITKSHSEEAINTKNILEEIKNFKSDKYIDLSDLKSSLRPYQTIGVNWLFFLYTYNLSALLCDDMGLGKTHQAMALISLVKKEGNFKYLVVCPTSVIYHWENLLKKYLPSIKVFVFHGSFRNIEKYENEGELLLTSYGILRMESKKISKIKFEIAIFDEIQIAKNKNSLTHKTLKKVNASMRLGLSGTPIENYLIELKAIFDLILPSYLPQDAIFKEDFIVPIEKNSDKTTKKKLNKIIKPFILRRKKIDVLKDLPEKTEEISYVDLSKEQEEIYLNILKSKNQIIDVLKNKNSNIPYMHIFSLLSKLKQVCDHPSLILNDVDNYEAHESGKFELLLELLDEAFQSNQKVVIFSQYLNMLKIIEKHLKKNDIKYASITGATKTRFLQIKQFNEEEDCKVFLASLLAAGVGIDLTKGSVVIHYDRWWNSAKEDQATDRVHRIGQNRGVMVFKMVSKNTIEERIHKIISRKRKLIEDLISIDEVDQIKTLTREELLEVFKTIEKN